MKTCFALKIQNCVLSLEHRSFMEFMSLWFTIFPSISILSLSVNFGWSMQLNDSRIHFKTPESIIALLLFPWINFNSFMNCESDSRCVVISSKTPCKFVSQLWVSWTIESIIGVTVVVRYPISITRPVVDETLEVEEWGNYICVSKWWSKG